MDVMGTRPSPEGAKSPGIAQDFWPAVSEYAKSTPCIVGYPIAQAKASLNGSNSNCSSTDRPRHKVKGEAWSGISKRRCHAEPTAITVLKQPSTRVNACRKILARGGLTQCQSYESRKTSSMLCRKGGINKPATLARAKKGEFRRRSQG